MLEGLVGGQGEGVLPPAVEQIIEAQFRSYFVYAWSSWYGKNLYQFASLLAIVLGMGLVAAESGNKTLSFLLTRPVSRRRVLAVKMGVGAAALAVIIAVSSLTLVIASVAAGHELPPGLFMLGVPAAWAGTMVIFSLTVLMSVRFSDQVKAAVAAAVLAGIMSLPSWVPRLRWLSIYRHMQGFHVMTRGEPDWTALAAMLAAGAVLALLAVHLFERRDVT
jgi:ABC-2 type transport system permease protein